MNIITQPSSTALKHPFSTSLMLFKQLGKRWKILTPIATVLFVGCGGGGSSQEPDPVTLDLPIAYVKRTLSTGVDDNDSPIPVTADIFSPRAFNGGARLFIRDRASSNAGETDITSSLYADGEQYDVKDLSPSFDGSKLAFAMRAPLIEGVDEDDPSQPTWNIWEYDLDSSNLRRVIANGPLAERGHDINPHYLPGDRRIVFSSTRQAGTQNIQTNENIFYNGGIYSGLTDSRDEDIGPAFVVHTMNADADLVVQEGQNIQQITYNQSHDLQPTVLKNGKVAFLRWDRAEGRDRLSLYTVNPDGSEMSFLYGYHSQNPIDDDNNATFFDLFEMPDSRLFAVLKRHENGDIGDDYPILGGDLVAINNESFTETDQPTAGGQASIAPVDIATDDSTSRAGYYNSAFPLDDGSNRLLVTWSPCRVSPPDEDTLLACTTSNLAIEDIEEADPLYGLWIYNPSNQTQQPIVVPSNEGEMFTDIIAVAPRTVTPILEDLDPSSGFGTLSIRSIYDFAGVAENTPNDASIAEVADPANPAYGNRTARFLRVVKAVSIPNDDARDFDNDAFGLSANRGMRQILGYTPIEPDGSVKVQIPANVAFHIEIVDASGQRLPEFQLHRNWLQLAAGEEKQCAGCHTADSELSHGRPEFEALSANSGAAATLPYPNTDPIYFADEDGETMADIESRIGVAGESRVRNLSPDLLYNDIWTNDTLPGLTKEADSELRYVDAVVDPTAALVTRVAVPPTNDACLQEWQRECRIIINYETHIQPLWEAPRTVGAVDRTCVSCHQGNTPDGQLNLTSLAVNFYITSYLELLENNITNPLRFVLVDGVQQFLMDDNGTPDDITDDIFVLDTEDSNQNGDTTDRIPLVEAAVGDVDVASIRVQRTLNSEPLFFQDADDNNIANGNAIPITDPAPTTPPLMTISNASDSRFFDTMDNSVSGTVDHSLFMSADELRLISEWLDIGAQYYNNPFDAPLN